MDEQAAPTTPAGWYPDPKMAGTQRYWDGERWSDHVAPLGGHAQPHVPARPSVSDSTIELIGWLGAIFLPIVGLVCGFVLSNRGNKRGLPILLLSIAMGTVLYFVATTDWSSGWL